MAEWQYLDLDLAVDQVAGGSGYVARVLSSPAGEAEEQFTFPLSEAELELFRVTVGPPRVTSRRLLPAAAPTRSAKTYGEQLNNALFAGPVADCFARSLAAAEREGKGLRLRLRLSGAPALDPVPWEYLWASSLGRFVALSAQTPVVRYYETRASARTLRVDPPIRVLVMVSSPTDTPALEVDKEVRLLQANTADLVKAGLLELVFEQDATLQKLQHHLSYGRFHIFHFIGHGAFDNAVAEGVLLFEGQDGTAHRVKGSYVGTLLNDARAMQLAVLNACEGARTSGQDTWSGVGQSVVRQGMPAVVAMQAEISDRAALAFSHEFYYALCQGFPVDAAVAEARKAIGGVDDGSEWGTPVLLQSATEQPFELITGKPVEVSQDVRFDSLMSEAQQAIASGNRELAEMLLSTLLSSHAGDDRTGTIAAGLATMGDGLLGGGGPAGKDAAPGGGSGGGDGGSGRTTVMERSGSGGGDGVGGPGGGSGGGGPGGGPGTGGSGPMARLGEVDGLLGGFDGGPGTGQGGARQERRDDDDRRGGYGTGDGGGGGFGKGVLAALSVVLLVVVAFVLWPKGGDANGNEAVTTSPSPTTVTTGATQTSTTTLATTVATTQATATLEPRAPTVVSIPFTEADKVIDAQIDDWPRGVTVTSSAQVSPTPGGRTTLSAQWWLAWNPNALFVYAVVTDPILTPVNRQDTSQAWRGDSISFEFGGYSGPLPRDARLRSTDMHIILGIGDANGGVVAQRNLSNGSVIVANAELTEVRAVWWKVDNGYAIEAAIPWGPLAFNPAADAMAVSNFNVSDAVPDGTRRGSLRVMVSSNASRTTQVRPGLWDVVKLVAG